jgi:hypothetical protein
MGSKSHRGRASRDIRPFAKLRRKDRVSLVLCVSWCDRKTNLNDMEANLRRAVAKVGATIVGVHREVSPRYEPMGIRVPAVEARECGLHACWRKRPTGFRVGRDSGIVSAQEREGDVLPTN